MADDLSCHIVKVVDSHQILEEMNSSGCFGNNMQVASYI